MTLLASVLTTFSLVACGSRGSSNPPPSAANEWFFVENFSGNIGGFSASSGKLEPIPGSSIMFSSLFPAALTNFAVKPDGTLLAAIMNTPQGGSTLQIANIASGGAISLTPLSATVTNPSGLAISSKGVLAITDLNNFTVQLFTVQNNLATGALPQDAVFSADGKTLYVGNDGDGTVSVFSVSDGGALQLVHTARFFVPSGGPGVAIVRARSRGRLWTVCFMLLT